MNRRVKKISNKAIIEVYLLTGIASISNYYYNFVSTQLYLAVKGLTLCTPLVPPWRHKFDQKFNSFKFYFYFSENQSKCLFYHERQKSVSKLLLHRIIKNDLKCKGLMHLYNRSPPFFLHAPRVFSIHSHRSSENF